MVVSNKDKIIIGIDPGIRNTGWGVIRHFQNKIEHIEHGVIVPEPNNTATSSFSHECPAAY